MRHSTHRSVDSDCVGISADAAGRRGQPEPPRRRRGVRGQAAVESVFVLLFVLTGFFLLMYYTYLGIAKLVGYHTTFVVGRSHVVGFENDIVYRAMEVGSIGLAGAPVTPDELTPLTPAQLGDREPALIEDFMQATTYTMDYERWPQVYANLSRNDAEEMVPARVWVSDYHWGDDDHPMPFGLNELSVDVNEDYWIHLYNHAGFYLE